MKRVLTRFRSSGLFGLALLLAVLLGVLAVLQYRWVGQLSQDESDRMRKHLHGRADDLADDFNRELTRIFVWLQVGPELRRDEPQAEEQRYEHWFVAAPHPELIRAIYQIDVDGEGQMAFRQYVRPEPHLVTAEWPAELAPIREALRTSPQGQIAFPAEPGPGRSGDPGGHRRASIARLPLLWPDLPVVIIPRARFYRLLPGQPSGNPSSAAQVVTTSGYTVAWLNDTYIREQLLPSLVARYFPDDGKGRTPHVAIESARGTVYATPGAPSTIFKTFDVEESLWDIRFGEFNRFVIDRRAERPHDAKDGKESKEKEGRQVATSIFYARDERGRSQMGVAGNNPLWKVHLLDKAGSLEAAVGRARWRNLLISFSVLVLLGSSMSLVLLSSARARRLAAQQMEFVAGVSHELRTPLTVIRSAGENLADGIVQDDQQVRKYGALIATEGRRLTQMVEQIMTFAGLQAGKPGLDIRPIEVASVIDDAMLAMGPLVREQQDAVIETDVAPGLPPVLADASAVSRCIQNLLGNALKYGGRPGRIQVSARAAAPTGSRQTDFVSITVTDDGPGIAARDLPHIFEPFYRGPDAVAAQIHGSGLGLSLVRRMMDELGGDVTVQSEPGRGAAFTLRLPVATDAVQPASAAVPAFGRGSDPTGAQGVRS